MTLPPTEGRAHARAVNPPGDTARRLLRDLIHAGGDDYRSLSQWLGRNDAYIQQYLYRGSPRRLAEADRLRLARYFGVADHRLDAAAAPDDGGGAAGDPPARPADHPRPGSARRPGAAPATGPTAGPDTRLGGLVRVPLVPLSASAGPGALGGDERIVGHHAFDRAWLRRLGLGPDTARMLTVTGDSMWPTLGDGDDILLDTTAASDRLSEGIFVVRHADALLVKRLAPGPGAGRVTLVSDNDLYPPMTGLPLDQVAIIGRVVWTGRRLR